MGVYYFDTSGLIERYVSERGSHWAQALLDPAAGNTIYVARITGVEAVAAFARRRRSGSLAAAVTMSILGQLRYHLANEYRPVEITVTTVTDAMTLAGRHTLRGYDAVQLAAALYVNAQRLARGLPPLTLVSADAELNAAAAVEGLAVEDPNTHR